MQIIKESAIAIPADSTLNPKKYNATQLSINLDPQRYVLVCRLGRVFERTNRDVIIDLLDAWLTENIHKFPLEEQSEISELLEERRGVHRTHPKKS